MNIFSAPLTAEDLEEFGYCNGADMDYDGDDPEINSNKEKEELTKELNKTEEILNSFSDEIEDDDEEEIPDPKENLKEATETIKDFNKVLGSDAFRDEVKKTAKRCKVSQRAVADNFAKRALGFIYKALGIVINVANATIHTLISFLAMLANAATNIIVKAANAIREFVNTDNNVYSF